MKLSELLKLSKSEILLSYVQGKWFATFHKRTGKELEVIKGSFYKGADTHDQAIANMCEALKGATIRVPGEGEQVTRKLIFTLFGYEYWKVIDKRPCYWTIEIDKVEQ